jgi:hypothetical protein
MPRSGTLHGTPVTYFLALRQVTRRSAILQMIRVPGPEEFGPACRPAGAESAVTV